MGGHWLIALLALPGACQEPPSYEQKLEIARHRIAQLERVVERRSKGRLYRCRRPGTAQPAAGVLQFAASAA